MRPQIFKFREHNVRQHSARWGDRRGHRTVCDLSTAIWSGVNSCVQELQVFNGCNRWIALAIKSREGGELLFSVAQLKRRPWPLTVWFAAFLAHFYTTEDHQNYSAPLGVYDLKKTKQLRNTHRLLGCFQHSKFSIKRHFTSKSSIFKGTPWITSSCCLLTLKVVLLE